MTSAQMWDWVERNYLPRKDLAVYESPVEFFDEMFEDAVSATIPFSNNIGKNLNMVNNVTGAFENRFIDKIQDAREREILTGIQEGIIWRPSFLKSRGFSEADISRFKQLEQKRS